jgi:hypothetical protein
VKAESRDDENIAMTTVTAIYANGVIRPVVAVELPENHEVRLSIERVKPAGGHPALRRLLEIAGRYPDNPNSPTDFSEQHDHYLYGTPKRP